MMNHNFTIHSISQIMMNINQRYKSKKTLKGLGVELTKPSSSMKVKVKNHRRKKYKTLITHEPAHLRIE